MSLNRHRDFIDQVFDKHKAERRTGVGQTMLQHLREKIERPEAENEALRCAVQALYRHHADIYKPMYNYSVNVVRLMKPILDQEIHQAGKYLLCGQAVSAAPVGTKSSNVVGIDKRDLKKGQEKLPARE
jgi:hypothetical protein